MEAEKAPTDTEKTTLDTDEAKHDAEEAKHSAEEEKVKLFKTKKDSEEAIRKFKIELGYVLYYNILYAELVGFVKNWFLFMLS